MAEAPATFTWTGGALVERDLIPHEALEVADSWFVSPAGRARALDAHRDRFLESIAERMPRADALDPEAFWGASIGRLRSFREAALFPRLELARFPGGGLELRLRVRVAPRMRDTAVLSTHRGLDPRRVPRIKGPDLETLIDLRAAAQENGADEVVLLDEGRVVDGSSSAILWWRGETLVAPAGDLARVASVTARSIRLIATATGTRVVEERARPADLAGCEVWIVSALRGITPVDTWIDGPEVLVRPERAAIWRKKLAALSRPL